MDTPPPPSYTEAISNLCFHVTTGNSSSTETNHESHPTESESQLNTNVPQFGTTNAQFTGNLGHSEESQVSGNLGEQTVQSNFSGASVRFDNTQAAGQSFNTGNEPPPPTYTAVHLRYFDRNNHIQNNYTASLDRLNPRCGHTNFSGAPPPAYNALILQNRTHSSHGALNRPSNNFSYANHKGVLPQSTAQRFIGNVDNSDLTEITFGRSSGRNVNGYRRYGPRFYGSRSSDNSSERSERTTPSFTPSYAVTNGRGIPVATTVQGYTTTPLAYADRSTGSEDTSVHPCITVCCSLFVFGVIMLAVYLLFLL